jgi:hypothetical protein
MCADASDVATPRLAIVLNVTSLGATWWTFGGYHCPVVYVLSKNARRVGPLPMPPAALSKESAVLGFPVPPPLTEDEAARVFAVRVLQALRLRRPVCACFHPLGWVCSDATTPCARTPAAPGGAQAGQPSGRQLSGAVLYRRVLMPLPARQGLGRGEGEEDAGRHARVAGNQRC